MTNWLAKLAQTDLDERARLVAAISELPPTEQEQLRLEMDSTYAPAREGMLAKMASADTLGRELAAMHGTQLLEKVALAGAVLGAAKNLAKPSIGNRLMSMAVKNPTAVAGGALGAAHGLISPGRDENGNQRSRLGAMLTHGAVGAGLGYGVGKIPMGKGSNVQKTLTRKIVGKGDNPLLGKAVQQYGQKSLQAVGQSNAAAARVGRKAVTPAATPAKPAATAPAPAPAPTTTQIGGIKADLAGPEWNTPTAPLTRTPVQLPSNVTAPSPSMSAMTTPDRYRVLHNLDRQYGEAVARTPARGGQVIHGPSNLGQVVHGPNIPSQLGGARTMPATPAAMAGRPYNLPADRINTRYEKLAALRRQTAEMQKTASLIVFNGLPTTTTKLAQHFARQIRAAALS